MQFLQFDLFISRELDLLKSRIDICFVKIFLQVCQNICFIDQPINGIQIYLRYDSSQRSIAAGVICVHQKIIIIDFASTQNEICQADVSLFLLKFRYRFVLSERSC